MIKKYIQVLSFIFCCYLFFSCAQKKEIKIKELAVANANEIKVLKRSPKATQTESVNEKESYGKKYVLAENGLIARDKHGDKIITLPYGSLVEIKGYTGDSLEVTDNGKLIKGQRVFTEVYVKEEYLGDTISYYAKGTVFDGYLGKSSVVKVLEKQLKKGVIAVAEDKEEELSRSILDSLLDIELITEDQFVSEKKQERLKIDTKKRKNTKFNDSILSFSIKDSIVTLKNKPNLEVEKEEYRYLGFVKELNGYLIKGEYWEWDDYLLIDQTTGSKTKFQEQPVLAPQKDKMITIREQLYDSGATLEVFSIDKDIEIHKEFELYFPNWVPYEDGKVYWISDTEFVLAIKQADPELTGNEFPKQYIKINLKK